MICSLTLIALRARGTAFKRRDESRRERGRYNESCCRCSVRFNAPKPSVRSSRALVAAALDVSAQPSSGIVPPPAVAAKAYVLLDVVSGQVLVAQNADEPREPASLTKLMTAYLTFDALRQKQLLPSQAVTVSERAWRSEGSRMFIEPKQGR